MSYRYRAGNAHLVPPLRTSNFVPNNRRFGQMKAPVDAIKQRDPEQAASRMREHLRSTRLAIFKES